MDRQFTDWKQPEFDGRGMTRWNWMCQYPEGLKLGRNADIGAFTDRKFLNEVRKCQNPCGGGKASQRIDRV